MSQELIETVVTSRGDVGSSHEFLTVEEAAKELRICRTTMYGILRDRTLGSITIGRRRLIARDQLNRFCAARKQMSLPPGLQRGGLVS